MKKAKSFLIGLFIFALCAPALSLAQGNLDDALGHLGKTGEKAGVEQDSDLSSIVGTIINAALSLVGIIFLVLMVYAGYMWMTAAGDEEKTGKAKKIITASIIGVILVVGAYAITVFVTERLGAG